MAGPTLYYAQDKDTVHSSEAGEEEPEPQAAAQ